ncbi:MAG: endonuclease/exonuclease/phosphatase family protein [Cyclobacteriaceae bacterium]|nr:endonuclease/exonuclease/phosphatase family protein [Cyclobacteriaceae bacterium]
MRLTKILRRRIFIIAIILLNIFCYASLQIPPHIFWPAAFLSYGFPVIICLNLILLTLALIQKRLTAFIWFLFFLLGAPYLLRTLRFNNSKKLTNTVRVLSFNAKLFRMPHVYNQFSTELINWIATDSSAIKCIQEYSTNPTWAGLDVTGQLKAAGYDGYTYVAEVDDRQHNPGLAIFSTYKIISTGVVWHNPQSLNAAIYADLQYGEKVIRIYNAHFTSMKLTARPDDWLGKVSYLFQQLKIGSVNRSKQVNILLEHLKNSPYPYLVCGDFNETPYSYVYSRMRRELTNAFEERGSGFGFTLNQKPYFLRIDHQFFGKEFKLQKYSVDRSMTISDHFPTYGYYILP